jgi:hypothetical protein
MPFRMSNRDFSHVTRVQQKASQNLFAGKVVTIVAQATTPGYIVKGGVPAGSVAIATNIGQAAAGATVSPFIPNPIALADAAGTNTVYNPTNAIATGIRSS